MRSYSNDLKQFGPAKADDDFEWTPKAFRLGLSWGLVQDNGELSETYIYHLCNEAHELVTSQFEVFLKEDWVPLHVHAAGKAKSAKQVNLDDFVYFISEVTGRPLTKYLLEIGQSAGIQTYNDKDDTFRPDQGLMDEFFEMAGNLIPDGEIPNSDEVDRWIVQSLFELINARLLLNLPSKKNHGHLLALYTYKVYEFSKMVKKVLNEFSKSSDDRSSVAAVPVA